MHANPPGGCGAFYSLCAGRNVRDKAVGDDESGKSANLHPVLHYPFCVLFYLLGHLEALRPCLNSIFKYFISPSLPSPFPSHSAVLAHFSFQLISMAFSNSSSPPLPSPPPSFCLNRLYLILVSCFPSPSSIFFAFIMALQKQ